MRPSGRPTLWIAGGALYIEEERYLKFGAGMGKMPGIGRMVRRGPYEVIEAMHMPTGNFVLRIGSPGVDHTLIWRNHEINLSMIAPPCGGAVQRAAGQLAESLRASILFARAIRKKHS